MHPILEGMLDNHELLERGFHLKSEQLSPFDAYSLSHYQSVNTLSYLGLHSILIIIMATVTKMVQRPGARGLSLGRVRTFESRRTMSILNPPKFENEPFVGQ